MATECISLEMLQKLDVDLNKCRISDFLYDADKHASHIDAYLLFRPYK